MSGVCLLKKIILGTFLIPYLVLYSTFAGYGYFNLMAMDWQSSEIHNSSQLKGNRKKGFPLQGIYI